MEANYNVMAGTALSWYRNHDPCHDHDVDIAIDIFWWIENFDRLEKALKAGGWGKMHDFGKKGHPGWEQAWKMESGFKVDLFSRSYLGNNTAVTGLSIGSSTYPCYEHFERTVRHSW